MNTDPFFEKMKALAGATGNPSWNPDPGTFLIGKLIEVRTGIRTQYGDASVANIRDERSGETVAVWLTPKSLKDQWSQVDPQPGERIGIKYHGLADSKNGRKYKAFGLLIDREQQPQPEPAHEPVPTTVYGEDEIPF